VRVVADSHAIVWFVTGSERLSPNAAEALRTGEGEQSITVSVATLLDLWYVTQTTQGVTTNELQRVREVLVASPAVDLHPIDEAVADAFTSISRSVLSDPWDRFIVATALVLGVPLVTRDEAIQAAGIVETVW
jgi:PIN domain nuclease of toxin-antitoxin system